MADQPGTYRLPPLDRGGVLLGLGAGQCAVLALGLAASVALSMGGRPAAALLPAVVASGLAWGRVGGEPILERAPVAVSWAVSGAARRADRRGTELWPGLALPRHWGHLELIQSNAGAAAMGVILDQGAGSATAVVAVAGGAFALAEEADQHRALAGWGRALAGFCRERSPVVRVAVLARSAPALRTSEINAPGLETGGSAGSSAVQQDYADLLARACSRGMTCDALVAVTVSARNLRAPRQLRQSALVGALEEQVRLLSGRLEDAGLGVGPPLDAEALRDDLSRRLLPRPPAPARSLVEALANSGGDDGVAAEWSSVRVGGASHACYWVSGWPRSEVGPSWCETLFAPTAGERVLALVFEPVAPSASRRRIERDATRLSSDTEQRRRAGFRIGFGDVRLADEVAEREAELGAGHAEVAMVAVVVVSAPDPAALARRCADEEQAAAAAGVELRRLDGRHHLALAWSLPLGLAPARRGLG
ncbi:MAG: hypothetical protein KY447_11130 [Actinobacteria bacterium]|nr:hypothetical protein [Actinomycetota bacterium]